MCSYCISSLFINVPLSELFDRSELDSPPFPYVDDTYTISKQSPRVIFFYNNLMAYTQLSIKRSKRKSMIPCHLWTFWPNGLTLDFLPVYIASPLLPVSTNARILFCPKQRKVNQVKTLVHRALVISSKTKLHAELDKLETIFLENGYPQDVISYTKTNLKHFYRRKYQGAS